MSLLSITSMFWPRKPPQNCLPLIQGPTDLPKDAPLPSDFNGLWNVAYTKYRLSLTKASRDHDGSFISELEHCTTPDEIMRALVDKTKLMSERRRGSEKSQALRDAINPIVRGLCLIMETAAETASAVNTPGGKGIFCAISVLLQAADRMSVTSDDLEKLFDRLGACVQRLNIRLKGQMSQEAKKIAVRALIQILKALELATTAIERSRFRRFVDELIGTPIGVRSALDTLEEITAEEHGLTLAEISLGYQKIASEVHSISVAVGAPLIGIPEDVVEVRPLAKHAEMSIQDGSLSVSQNFVVKAGSAKHSSTTDATSHSSMHALIIGIDFYAAGDISDLQSAVLDADMIYEYLRTDLHVPDDQIVVLRNEQATQRAIIKHIRSFSACKTLRKGDPVLIYFAGHGATLTTALRTFDDGGESSLDEGGRSISLIMPHDCTVSDHRIYGTISYRTLDLLLCELALGSINGEGKGDNITVIFDCCASLTTPGSIRRLDEDTTRLFDSSFLSDTPKPTSWPYVLLSGSSEGEVCSEHADFGGAFTRQLVETLRNGRIEELTYQNVMMDVSRRLEGQNPSCQGRNADRILFSAHRQPQIPDSCHIISKGSPHEKENDGRFRIQRGAIHDVAEGDQFLVYCLADAAATSVVSSIAMTAVATDVGGSCSELSPEPSAMLSEPAASCAIIALPAPSTYALCLHISGDSEDVSVVVPMITLPREYNLLICDDESMAHLSICKGGNRIEYLLCDSMATAYGLRNLCETTPADPHKINCILRAASRFFKRLHIRPEKKTISKGVTLECHELKGDLSGSTMFGYDGPINDGENLCHLDTIKLKLDGTSKDYGITLFSRVGLMPLHVWIFYYDYSDLSIREIYRPLFWGVECGKPSLPAGGRLRIGYGLGQGEPFRVPRRPNQRITVGCMKVFLSASPFDMSGFDQSSPFEPTRSRAIMMQSAIHRDYWDVLSITVVQK